MHQMQDRVSFHRFRVALFFCGVFVFVLYATPHSASAQLFDQDSNAGSAPLLVDVYTGPQSYRELQEIESETVFDAEDISQEIRKGAQKEAALSYGARAGLSKRTYEIRQYLINQERSLDKIYDFRRLLLRAPSGLLMEPPIIDEALDNLIIDDGGQGAAVADRILNIDRPAKIVTAARDWRTYLERQWGDVPPPPDILLPQDYTERVNWRKWVEKGWREGYAQAEEIFQTDLDRLVADFRGMVRYRVLLAQDMVSAPFALHEDRGITGGGNELRIGDRAVKITGPSELKPGAETWQPADR